MQLHRVWTYAGFGLGVSVSLAYLTIMVPLLTEYAFYPAWPMYLFEIGLSLMFLLFAFCGSVLLLKRGNQGLRIMCLVIVRVCTLTLIILGCTNFVLAFHMGNIPFFIGCILVGMGGGFWAGARRTGRESTLNNQETGR